MAEEILTLQTNEVIETLINKYNDKTLELINFHIQEVDERVGLLGEHAFLHAEIKLKEENKTRKVKLFLKFFPRNEPAAFARGTGVFTKEIFVYNLFNRILSSNIRTLTNCSPKCYFTRDEYVIVLDNLIEEGFKTFDKYDLLDVETLNVVLASLASLHASSLIFEEKLTRIYEKPYRLIEDYERNFVESFYNGNGEFFNKKGVDASIKCILKEIDIFNLDRKLRNGKYFKNVANEMCSKIFELVKPSTKHRNVVCHGDLWATNFLVKYCKNGLKPKPDQCKFVDFQCARYVPPSHDVMSVLHLTTTKEFRKKHMYKLIGHYYACLERSVKIYGLNLDDIIPFREFLESCEEQKLFALIQAATYFQLILVDSKVVEKFYKSKELYEKAFFEDRSVLVLEYLDKDERYRVRLKESMEDLREYCEFYA